jgi:imidazolonepropionase-like amidohydrolase
MGVAESGEISYLPEQDLQVIASEGIIAIRIAGSVRRNKQDCAVEKQAGSDFIKICYSGNIENRRAQNPWLSYQELRRIVQNKGEKKAVVVANSRQQVAEALEAGCDAIEQGYAMGEANLRKMADRDVLWIPSVLRVKNALDTAGSGGEVGCRFSTRYVTPKTSASGEEPFWKNILAEQLNQLRLAKKLGVTTAAGTGAGSAGILHGESMVEEMKLFITAGYSLEETIRCASENGARFFGMENLGTLAVGKRATFLITRGTVQQLPRKLSYLEGIYVDGVPSALYQKNPVIIVP